MNSLRKVNFVLVAAIAEALAGFAGDLNNLTLPEI